MRHKNSFLLVLFPVLFFTLFLNGCDGGGGDDNNNFGDISRFEGTYVGTFNGNDSGTFTVDVDERGGITGSGNSISVGFFRATGLVEENGDVDFGIATTSAVFNGRISESGAISGQWINGSASGTFSGSRR